MEANSRVCQHLFQSLTLFFADADLSQAGDVAARAGVQVSEADEALQALAFDTEGALEVSCMLLFPDPCLPSSTQLPAMHFAPEILQALAFDTKGALEVSCMCCHHCLALHFSKLDFQFPRCSKVSALMSWLLPSRTNALLLIS